MNDLNEIVSWPAANWLETSFGDTMLTYTPGHGIPNQTTRRWFETATNSQVEFVANTDRWDGYTPGHEGLACEINEAGEIIPWSLDLTREEIDSLSIFPTWNNHIVPLLQAEGIDTDCDRDNIICLVWMENWNLEQASALWPQASMSGGWCQIGSNYGSDITSLGVLLHELAHAGPNIRDAYVGSYNDFYNVMTSAVYNAGGWTTPYFAPSQTVEWYPPVSVTGWEFSAIQTAPAGISSRAISMCRATIRTA
jgi:hypothetical protein